MSHYLTLAKSESLLITRSNGCQLCMTNRWAYKAETNVKIKMSALQNDQVASENMLCSMVSRMDWLSPEITPHIHKHMHTGPQRYPSPGKNQIWFQALDHYRILFNLGPWIFSTRGSIFVAIN